MPDNVPITPEVPSAPVVGASERRLQNLLDQADMQAQVNAPFRRTYYKTLQKGALANFQYLHWKHDPYPLILVSAVYTALPRPNMVAGINMHYLTFQYIKYLINQYCGKQFSYPLIKGNIYIKNAFRTYKRSGMRLLKMLDCDYLMTILGATRSFKPHEVEAIRRFVQEQLRKQMNPSAEDIARQYEEMILNDPQGRRYREAGHDLGKLYGRLPQPPVVPPYGKVTRGDQRFKPRDVLPPE